jgi:hypothetical protein
LNENYFVILTIIGPAERIGPSIMFEAVSSILESGYDNLIEFSEVNLSWAFRLGIL